MGKPRAKRITIHTLICDKEMGLGYCCEWIFFRLYKDTALIATRLGVTKRAVRYHKAADRACAASPACLKGRV
jgi:hypothetical protein